MTQYWRDTVQSARQMRRTLHARPELGWQENETCKLIRQSLTDLDIPWETCAGLGTLGRLAPNKTSDASTHIALRGDMDALPILEKSGRPWASEVSGCMHACGHDGHTATLLAAARWLKYHEDSLSGPVTLLFQPAEEGGHGALKMMEDGALRGIDAIYGWHNWPAIPFGRMVCPDGLVMCGNGTFELLLTGRGGHASQPELCRDPVLAASAITLAMQQLVSRRLSPQRTAVVSITSIDAPSGPTVIPETAVLGGSIRVPDERTREEVNRLITEIATHTAASYGVHCEVRLYPRYQATINHPQAAHRARTLWQHLYGDDALDTQLELPVMASEDFSYYLQEIPGAFALIGSDDGDNHDRPCHSPYYDFNDRLIPRVTRYFSELAGIDAPALSTTDD